MQNAFIGQAVKVIVGNFTRDINLASGNQAVAGVGFTPKAVIFIGCKDSSSLASIGIDEGTNRGTISDAGGGAPDTWIHDFAKALYAITSAGNTYHGIINSLDVDGFTIAWTKVGVNAGNFDIVFLAIG